MNRSAVVVIAKQPFLDWLHAVDPTSHHLTLSDLNAEQSIYLLPDSDKNDQAAKHLRKFCKQIFAEELDGWWREPSPWPKDLSYRAFTKWFEWRHHSIVFDVTEVPLCHEQAC